MVFDVGIDGAFSEFNNTLDGKRELLREKCCKRALKQQHVRSSVTRVQKRYINLLVLVFTSFMFMFMFMWITMSFYQNCLNL